MYIDMGISRSGGKYLLRRFILKNCKEIGRYVEEVLRIREFILLFIYLFILGYNLRWLSVAA